VHDSSGGSNTQAGVSGYLNDSNTAYYSVQGGKSEGSGSSGSASLNVDTAKAKLGFGYSQGSDYHQSNVNVSGSVVAHAGGITLGQPVGESFALVEVPDVKGVGLTSYSGVQTDGNGYAVMPYTNPYRLNWLSLDTQDLGGSVEIENATQQVVPRRGSIVKATFAALSGRRVQFELSLADGQKIPFGAFVKDEDDKVLGVVDNQSKVLVFGIEDEGLLDINWNNDSQCAAKYKLPKFNQSKSYDRVSIQCD
jgi:outer membrane usher protein